MSSLLWCSLLLLAIHPALSVIYTDLAVSLSSSFLYLSRDRGLFVNSTGATIHTQDFSEIFVWDSNTIFVGAANYILKIDSNLVIENTYSISSSTCTPMSNIFLDTCANYFRVFLNINNTLYTCYTNRDMDPVCVALDPVTLTTLVSPPTFNQVNSVPQGFISPTQPTLLYQRNFATYIVDINNNSRLITGSVYDNSDRNRVTVLDPFLVGTGSTPFITTTFYYFEDPNDVQKFFFAASFARTVHNYVNSPNNYIYFMFYEPSNTLISGLAFSRVARFCLQGQNNDNPTPNTALELPQMETFIKGELQCGTVFPSLVQDWLYVQDGTDYLYYAVFSSLEKGPQTSYLCIYSLNAISAIMNSTKTCDPDTTLETSTAVTPISGEPTLGHVGGLFTQLQRYTFDFASTSYEIIYISLSNGSLIKYCLSCPTDLQLVQLMQVVPMDLLDASKPELNALDRLQLNGKYLLAGGYTGLYRVPLQTCVALGANYIECLRDPMCYFNLNTGLCEALTAGTANTSSILHFSQFTSIPLPPIPSCSLLTGTLSVSTISQSTSLSYSWTCVADFVTIVLRFSNGSSQTFLQPNSTGSQIVSLPYFFLNDTLISSFYILPFFSTNGIDRALPGPVLYSYVTYDVTQPLPSAPTICTPLPPICLPPVCTDNPSCREYCARVRIDCSLTGDACADEVRYTLNGENPIISSHPFQIMVSSLMCGRESCLFQAYARNTTTGITTTGSSHWLHLLPSISLYTPVLKVTRVPTVYNQVAVSASFAEFSTHTCATPDIQITPSSSPYTLTSCRRSFTAQGNIGSDFSQTAVVEVSSSQEVLPPVSLQINIIKLSDRDACSFLAEVTVSWQQPGYTISGDGFEYLIEGSACGLATGISVTDVVSYVCPNVALYYNTLYSVYVTSYEPCFKNATATEMANSTTMLATPSGPRGLGYELYTDRIVVTWSPPDCVNSDDPIMYRAMVYRSPCGGISTELIHNTTDTNTAITIPFNSSDIYNYTIGITVVAGARESSEARLTVFSPMGEEFNCETCRVDRVTINANLSDISWTTSSGCGNLEIDRFYVTLYRDTNLLDTTDVPGTDRSLPGSYTPYLEGPGTYKVSVRLVLRHECSKAECVSGNSNAFLIYATSASSSPTTTVVTGSAAAQCQDEKAYIILGLAVVAIACAVGNFGFMFVAFCVFCVPRKKVLCC